MIKNIIFDFGDIFINLDKKATKREAEIAGASWNNLPEIQIFHDYETGKINTKTFLKALTKLLPNCNEKELAKIWNAIILDFPEYRLDFIEDLASKKTYRLFLLSNTNSLHIEQVIQNMGLDRYHRFKSCFEQFYLSHEIGFRKPNSSIYSFVLQENKLQATETIFIDDTKENTDAAEKMGIKTWNLTPKQEDIVELFHLDYFK